MSKNKSKIGIGYEITPTAQKVGASAEIPNEGANELAFATARFIDSIRQGSEKVGKMLCNSASMLGKPIGALIEGKTAEIELANQFITARLLYVKETNAIMHLKYVAEELNKKIENNEPIPEEIKKSDKLYLIQDNASTTSDEEFLKLWAKLYAEEACKPGTVSRQTINILKSLDLEIVKILEQEIFPYCDQGGFYWGASDSDVTSIMIAQDYGFIDSKDIIKFHQDPKVAYCVALNKTNNLYIYPGYGYSPKNKYILTKSGLEIKNILKIFPKSKNIKIMLKEIEKSATHWHIIKNHNVKYKKQPSAQQKFIVCDKNNKIKFPQNAECKTYENFCERAMENMVKGENAQ